MKKIIALLLTLALLVSLAACGTTPATTDPVATNKPAEGTSAGNNETEAPAELVTIKILAKDTTADLSMEKLWDGYRSVQTMLADLEAMGIKLEIEWVPAADFANIVTTRMSAGVDLPDLVAVAFDGMSTSDIISWGQNGLIIPASDLMEQYDTDGSIAAYWDLHAPGSRTSQYAPDGKLYWFNGMMYDQVTYSMETGKEVPANNFRLPSIRADWVEAVGEEVKLTYTPDELIALLQKFQEQDVNGNGVKDEVVNVKIDTFYDNFARAFGLNTNLLCYVDENGKVQSNFYDPAFVDYIEFMQKLYELGLYDTTAFTGDAFTSELLTTNRSAITYNYALWGAYEEQIAVEGANCHPFVLDLTGSLSDGWYAQGDIPGDAYNPFFVTSACEHPEAIVKMFDYFYTDYYSTLCMTTLGILNDLDENGVLVPLDFDTQMEALGRPYPYDSEDPEVLQEAWNYYFPLSYTNVSHHATSQIQVMPSYIWQVEEGASPVMQDKQTVVRDLKAEENWNTCDFQIRNVLAIATDEEQEITSAISEVLSTYASELLSDLILGKKSLDDMDTYLAEMEELGLTEYMAVYQARADRAAAAK